ncbi:hypothetical protein BE11_27620 [Sorangium cellulosum]|nr:hypothetical protein BE11_27620 [Sorangium cellulosum]
MVIDVNYYSLSLITFGRSSSDGASQRVNGTVPNSLTHALTLHVAGRAPALVCRDRLDVMWARSPVDAAFR